MGENSKALINGSKISGNIIGIAIKDKSFAKIEKSEFINNKVQIVRMQKIGNMEEVEMLKYITRNFKQN